MEARRSSSRGRRSPRCGRPRRVPYVDASSTRAGRLGEQVAARQARRVGPGDLDGPAAGPATVRRARATPGWSATPSGRRRSRRAGSGRRRRANDRAGASGSGAGRSRTPARDRRRRHRRPPSAVVQRRRSGRDRGTARHSRPTSTSASGRRRPATARTPAPTSPADRPRWSGSPGEDRGPRSGRRRRAARARSPSYGPGSGDAVPARRREDQVGLPLRHGQPLQPGEHLRVAGDTARPLREAGRVTRRRRRRSRR